jgi:hypothetical protein
MRLMKVTKGLGTIMHDSTQMKGGKWREKLPKLPKDWGKSCMTQHKWRAENGGKSYQSYQRTGDNHALLSTNGGWKMAGKFLAWTRTTVG